MKATIRAFAIALLLMLAFIVFAVIQAGGVDKARARANATAVAPEAGGLFDPERLARIAADAPRQAKLREAQRARMAADSDAMVWNGLAQDECLSAIAQRAKVPGSVSAKPETWPVAREGKHWVVLADYTAKNALGVTLRGRAACRLTQAGAGFELASLKVS